MVSFELQIGIVLMLMTIIAIAILLLASQETPKNIPEDPNAGPLKQLRILEANHPLQGAIVLLGIIGCGSGFAVLLTRLY